MSSRPDATSLLLRFIVGAVVGAFAAFWLALASEAAALHFGAVTLLAALLGGGLAQVSPTLAGDWLHRAAPYVLGFTGIALLYLVVTSSFALKNERARCLECCIQAGFPAMIYARENRLGPLYCTCSDREDPEHPRSDEDVCFNAGRKER